MPHKNVRMEKKQKISNKSTMVYFTTHAGNYEYAAVYELKFEFSMYMYVVSCSEKKSTWTMRAYIVTQKSKF